MRLVRRKVDFPAARAAKDGARTLIEQGTEAMKKSAIAAALLIFTASAVGCRTTSKFPWVTMASKTAAETTAESTAVAHSAPALPSDLAKKSQVAAPSSAQLAGGEAAPWVPNANATAQATRPAASNYPTTAAPAFSPEAAKQAAGSTVASAAKEASSANLGSIAMRYDPTKAPPTSTTAAVAQATTPTTADRYGATTSAPAAGAAQRTTDVIASAPSFGGFPSGSRYGVPAASADATAQASAAPAASAPAATKPGVISPSNRYAQAAPATTVAAGTTTAAPANRYANTATPASAIAEVPATGAASTAPKAVEVAAATQPFRPGGTSTYPSVPSLASRPQSGASSSTTAPAPTSSTPASSTTPTSPSSSTSAPSRYW
jgi:hypothetical protein